MMPKPKCEPKVAPCYCCPFGYTIKPFGYDIPCPMPPLDHPMMWDKDWHGKHHKGHHGMPPMMEEPRMTDAESE